MRFGILFLRIYLHTERNPARIFVTGIDVSQKKWDKRPGRRFISIMRISYTDRFFSLWVADYRLHILVIHGGPIRW